MKIRELSKNDYSSVVRLLKQLGYGDNNATSLSERYAIFKKHKGIVFVVEDELKNVVGFAAITIMPLIHCDGLLARIAGICIDEKQRSGGIGAELIKYIENYCIEKECVLLEVTTNLVREKAHQFYLNNGFVETHKRYNKKPERRL
jgi:N-acetylglutamate synthase-like GNAT family acetyltransferase